MHCVFLTSILGASIMHNMFETYVFRMATKLVIWPNNRTTADVLCFSLNTSPRQHKLRLRTFPSSNTVRQLA